MGRGVVPRRSYAQYSNFRLPVVTNVVVVMICLAAISGTARLSEHRRVAQAEHASRFVTAEWQLLAQLKADTDRQLQARDRQIAELRRRLLALPENEESSREELAQRSRLQSAIEAAYLDRQQILSRRLAEARPDGGTEAAVAAAGTPGSLPEAADPAGPEATGAAADEVAEAAAPPAAAPAEVEARIRQVRQAARAAGYSEGVSRGREEGLEDIAALVAQLRGYEEAADEVIATLLDVDPLYYDVARDINEIAAAEIPEARLYFEPPRLIGVVARVSLDQAEIELAGDLEVLEGQTVEFRRRLANGRLRPLCTSEVTGRVGGRVLVSTCPDGAEVSADDVVYTRSRRIE